MRDEIEEKLKELRGVLGVKADKLRLAWLFEVDPDAKRSLESAINIMHAKHFADNAILLQPPSSTAAQGDYPLGTVQYNGKNLYPFGLREFELPQHVLIAGRSGSGKSNTMIVLAKEFISRGKPLLLFSFKREYRSLLSYSPHVSLFTCGRQAAPFHFNPFRVPRGTDRDTWVNLLAEAMATTYFAGEGVMSVLRKGLSHVYDHSPNPKASDLKIWLDELQRGQRRESDWLVSTRRIVDAMCFGSLGEVLNADSPVDLETLLDKQVILELDNFNDDDRTFLIQCVMRWVYRYALENFPRNDCKYAVMIDEAHHVFLKKASDMSGKETYSDAILRQVRECSVSFVLADQHPSLISLPALGNTFTTIGMNLKTRADCLAIGNAMLLTEEQREYLGRLPVGAAVVKLQDRFTEPFMVQIPKVELPAETPDDKAIASHLASFYPKPTPPLRLEELPRPTPESGVSMAGTAEPPLNPVSPVAEESSPHALPDPANTLSELEQAFLIHIHEHPFTGTNTRYSQLQVSTRHGIEAKDKLVQLGYIVPVPINLQHNVMTLFDFTERGKSWLVGRGLKLQERREGGIEHRFGCWAVAKYYQEHGFSTQVEKRTPSGRFIDVVAAKDGRLIANEIETGKSDVMANVVNAFADGFAELQIIATTEEAHQKCRRLLAEFKPADGQRLEICYLLPHIQTNADAL